MRLLDMLAETPRGEQQKTRDVLKEENSWQGGPPITTSRATAGY